MGQKVNPNGLRLGIKGQTRTWQSNWYAEKDFAKYLNNDMKIRKYLSEKLKDASVSSIVIERANNKTECNSFAANNTTTSTCKTTNWLSKNLSLWTITPNMSESRFIFTIAADGTVSNAGTDFGSSTFPVVYLASDTTLTGDGSQNNSFQIK